MDAPPIKKPRSNLSGIEVVPRVPEWKKEKKPRKERDPSKPPRKPRKPKNPDEATPQKPPRKPRKPKNPEDGTPKKPKAPRKKSEKMIMAKQPFSETLSEKEIWQAISDYDTNKSGASFWDAITTYVANKKKAKEEAKAAAIMIGDGQPLEMDEPVDENNVTERTKRSVPRTAYYVSRIVEGESRKSKEVRGELLDKVKELFGDVEE